MILSTKQKQAHRIENKLVVAKVGSSGSVDANYYI